jgi:hypothetical protein
MNDAGAAVLQPTIPTFDGRSYRAWIRGRAPTDTPKAAAMTPAVPLLRAPVGASRGVRVPPGGRKAPRRRRTRERATNLKARLAALPKVRLRTPRSPELSAGLVCFGHSSIASLGVVDALRSREFVATVTPYATEYVGLAPEHPQYAGRE